MRRTTRKRYNFIAEYALSFPEPLTLPPPPIDKTMQKTVDERSYRGFQHPATVVSVRLITWDVLSVGVAEAAAYAVGERYILVAV